MPTLYVTEPGATVRRRGGSLIVTTKGGANDHETVGESQTPTRRKLLLEVEPHRLEMVALVGRAHATSTAIRLCLEHGIAISWMTRNGDLLGRIVPELSRTADLRFRQFRLVDDSDASLELGRWLIDAKVANASAMITAIRSNRSGRPELGRAIADLNEMRQRVGEATTRDQLMGFEGAAAKVYFSALQSGFSGQIGFAGRRRRPPPDPANALLSFGYVLLANLISGHLEARGLDPYIGVLHSMRSGRAGLALDLMEEFRHSLVDRFVLRICNRRQFGHDDFKPNARKGGVRLKIDALRRFFREWEKLMNGRMHGIDEDRSAEQIVLRQVDRLAAHFRGTEQYRPFIVGQEA